MRALEHKAVLPFLAVVLACCSCSSHRETPSQLRAGDEHEWAVVALVAGVDKETQSIVRQVLQQKGIVCLMEGSVGYAVEVPKPRLAEARKLLQDEPRLKGRGIRLPSVKNCEGQRSTASPHHQH